MAYAQSPDHSARNRYAANFQSTIFEQQTTPRTAPFVPAGKRRDQTTSELFGTFDGKDLRGMPKTFVPKEAAYTARQQKQNFLSSDADILPCSPRRLAAATNPAGREEPAPGSYYQEASPEDDDNVDTNMRRQRELQSTLFGRASPIVDAQQLHDRSLRLTPNDFSWHSHPENTSGGPEMTHSNRAYQEKCSGLFDHRSPQMQDAHVQHQQLNRQQDVDEHAKRRSNAHFSNLFGRAPASPAAFPQDGEESQRYARHRGSDEDMLCVHQDWTDAKTELLSRASRPEHPALRKGDELHQARLFGTRSDSHWEAPMERVASVTHDNSEKVRSAVGKSTQQIHQAHLRSSLAPDDFHRAAEESRQWEVAELHISGLGMHADDNYVRDMCTGFDLQLVKVVAEVDPVRNLCKGRARVMVRYNPARDSVKHLVASLEDRRLRVDV